MRARCGCLIEDGIALHGLDGPCFSAIAQGPTEEEYCDAMGHPAYAEQYGEQYCYCGKVVERIKDES